MVSPTGGAPHPAGVSPPPGRTRKGEVDSDSLFRVFRWIPWLISDPPPDREPAARLQEPGHDAHHQWLFPAPSRGVGHRRGGRSARRVLPGFQAQPIGRAKHARKTCGFSVTIDRAGGRARLAEGAAKIAAQSGNRSALMHHKRCKRFLLPNGVGKRTIRGTRQRPGIRVRVDHSRSPQRIIKVRSASEPSHVRARIASNKRR